MKYIKAKIIGLINFPKINPNLNHVTFKKFSFLGIKIVNKIVMVNKNKKKKEIINSLL